MPYQGRLPYTYKSPYNTTLDQGTQTVPSLAFLGDTNNGVFSPATDNVAITTNGSEKLRVTDTGNVGIGTSNPNIAGWGKAITLQGVSNAAYEVTDGTVRTSLISAAGAFGIVGTDTNHPFYIRTNSIERVRVTETGNIGIGTTNPGYKLDVLGSSLFVANIRSTYTVASKEYTSLLIGSAGYETASHIGHVYDTATPSNSFFHITPYGSQEGNVFSVKSSGNVGIGTTNPTSKLQVNGKISNTSPSTLSTTLDSGFNIQNTSTKTYPTTSSFAVYPGIYQNIELGTSQIIDTVTPGGFNFVYGIQNTLTKSAGNTQDIERLYFNGFSQNFIWADANTCKQYVGISDSFVYRGINANGRTSSSLSADAINLNPPDGGTQTIANVTGRSGIGYAPQGTSTINATNSFNVQANLSFSNFSAGTKTVNITNHTFFGISSFWGTGGTTGTLNATITNLYGLRLIAPASSTGLTVTNNWGISQEWVSAKNYFAGNVGIGTTNPGGVLHVYGGSASRAGMFSSTDTTAYNPTSYSQYHRVYLQGGSAIDAYNGIGFTNNSNCEGFIGFVQNTSGYGDFVVQSYHGSYGEKFRIKSNGNIGIGTTNPSEKLEVVGKFRLFDGGYPYIDIGVTTSNYFRLIHDNPNDRFYIGKNNNVTLVITGSNNVEPGVDNAYNLGSSTKRWANIYSADLQLSNEGSSNDVDGTWGAYTIQEGENDLYLLNRRNGKKYKFVLQEVN